VLAGLPPRQVIDNYSTSYIQPSMVFQKGALMIMTFDVPCAISCLPNERTLLRDQNSLRLIAGLSDDLWKIVTRKWGLPHRLLSAGSQPMRHRRARQCPRRRRGREAVAELLALRGLPVHSALQETATAHALQAIVDLDLSTLGKIAPPRRLNPGSFVRQMCNSHSQKKVTYRRRGRLGLQRHGQTTLRRSPSLFSIRPQANNRAKPPGTKWWQQGLSLASTTIC